MPPAADARMCRDANAGKRDPSVRRLTELANEGPHGSCHMRLPARTPAAAELATARIIVGIVSTPSQQMMQCPQGLIHLMQMHIPDDEGAYQQSRHLYVAPQYQWSSQT